MSNVLLKMKVKKLTELKNLMEKRNKLLLKEKLKNDPVYGMRKLLENEVEKAELILAARNLVNELQDQAEKLSKMQVEDVLPLVDSIKGEFGVDVSEAFGTAVNDALNNALESVKSARESVNAQMLSLEGKISPEDAASSDMMNAGGEEEATGGEAGGDEGGDLFGDEGGDEGGDLFGGAEAASGEKEEPLGRSQKESFRNKKGMVEAKSCSKGKKVKKKVNEAYEFLSFAVSKFTSEMNKDPNADFNSKIEEVARKCSVDPQELFNAVTADQREVEPRLATYDESPRGSSWHPGISHTYESELNKAINELGKLSAREVCDKYGFEPQELKEAMERKVKRLSENLATTIAKNIATDDDLAKKSRLSAGVQKKIGGILDKADDKNMPPNQQDKLLDRSTSPADKKELEKAIGNLKNPKDLKKVITASRDMKPVNTQMVSHTLIEDVEELDEAEAATTIKDLVHYVRTGKGYTVQETFPHDIKLSNPRSIVEQMVKKYGEPKSWQIFETADKAYYILSGPIPNPHRAKELQEQIQSLTREAQNIRKKHGDVDESYRLPQEIKIDQLQEELGKVTTGFRHTVANWLGRKQAESILTLARGLGKGRK